MANPRQQNSSGEPPPTELITQFLQNQSEELKNQSREIELRKINEQNGYNYACKALEAQRKDREAQRGQVSLFMKYGFWLTMVILLLAATFVVGCIYTDNVALIVSVLKVLAYIVPTAIGGYFLGHNRGKKSATHDKPAEYTEMMEE